MVGENGEDNSLMYVPRSVSQLEFETTTVGGVEITPAQQAAALEQFISENDYLSTMRGEYTARNADRSPFEGVVDLNFKLELFGDLVGRQQKVEVTADIFNFSDMLGDLVGADWGNRYFGASQFSPIQFRGFENADDGNYTPVYSAEIVKISETEDGQAFFDGAIDQEEMFDLIETGSTYSAQWQMKFGIRYTF